MLLLREGGWGGGKKKRKEKKKFPCISVFSAAARDQGKKGEGSCLNCPNGEGRRKKRGDSLMLLFPPSRTAGGKKKGI